MKLLKVYNFLMIALILAVSVGMVVTVTTEKLNGYGSAACPTITQSSKEWINNEFGDANDFNDLLSQMNFFVCNNFVYDDKDVLWFPIQHFNFEHFRKSNWHGICWDFSMWAKVVVNEVSKTKGWDIKSFVVDAKLLDGSHHSYNFFETPDGTWYVDYTAMNTAFKEGKSIIEIANNIAFIGATDKYDYAKNHYGDIVYNVH